ncbi:unnamed protein product [Amoebophrya sp. A120]|nr:unnamed protein product [Amoebophrya sp. A120]|eukprot:GSA120T00018280001.1
MAVGVSDSATAQAQELEPHACDCCGTRETEGSASVQLRACTGCKRVYYCSRECQKREWKSHKLDCKSKRRETRGPQETTASTNPASSTSAATPGEDALEAANAGSGDEGRRADGADEEVDALEQFWRWFERQELHQIPATRADAEMRFDLLKLKWERTDAASEPDVRVCVSVLLLKFLSYTKYYPPAAASTPGAAGTPVDEGNCSRGLQQHFATMTDELQQFIKKYRLVADLAFRSSLRDDFRTDNQNPFRKNKHLLRLWLDVCHVTLLLMNNTDQLTFCAEEGGFPQSFLTMFTDLDQADAPFEVVAKSWCGVELFGFVSEQDAAAAAKHKTEEDKVARIAIIVSAIESIIHFERKFFSRMRQEVSGPHALPTQWTLYPLRKMMKAIDIYCAEDLPKVLRSLVQHMRQRGRPDLRELWALVRFTGLMTMLCHNFSGNDIQAQMLPRRCGEKEFTIVETKPIMRECFHVLKGFVDSTTTCSTFLRTGLYEFWDNCMLLFGNPDATELVNVTLRRPGSCTICLEDEDDPPEWNIGKIYRCGHWLHLDCRKDLMERALAAQNKGALPWGITRQLGIPHDAPVRNNKPPIDPGYCQYKCKFIPPWEAPGSVGYSTHLGLFDPDTGYISLPDHAGKPYNAA